MAYVNTTLAPNFADRMRSILTAVKTRRAQNRLYRQTVRELSQLSNRELADLGLSRYEIRRIALETCDTI